MLTQGILMLLHSALVAAGPFGEILIFRFEFVGTDNGERTEFVEPPSPLLQAQRASNKVLNKIEVLICFLQMINY